MGSRRLVGGVAMCPLCPSVYGTCDHTFRRPVIQECGVVGCTGRLHLRGVCTYHFRLWMRLGATSPQPVLDAIEDDPVCCVCAEADPDSIGECRRCRRRYLSPARIADLRRRLGVAP